jgi:hypothetical protein
MTDRAMVTVDANALRQVLQALTGPAHLIREIQMTRSIASLTGDDPIGRLVDDYNEDARRQAGTSGVDVPRAAQRTLPHPGSPEASAMLDSLLAEYNYPANTKNAARAGWEAANRWLQQNASTGVDSVDGGQHGA